MTLLCFCVHDAKANAFLTPFFMQSAPLAIRAFETTVNDHSTEFNRYPADFQLFEVGSFDDTLGLLHPHSAPKLLVNAISIKQQNFTNNFNLSNLPNVSNLQTVSDPSQS